MMMKLHTQDDLRQAIDSVVKREPKFNEVVERFGIPSLRRTPANLESLLRIVTEQFLSLKAAAAIWDRLHDHLSEFSAGAVLACPQQDLVLLGLSRSKAKCFHACAAADIRFDDVESMRNVLLAIWGIGPWSVDIFMLSATGDADAWPAGDVALQAAAHDLFTLPARPSIKSMVELAEPWRPYRAVVARLLWSHYRGLKSMTQAQDSPSQN